ncbi:S-adenosyl-L-methionine-dependent methyltransferase, partial [Chytriomyces sp. MP71]
NVICEPIRATLNQPGVKILDVGCSNGVWLDAVFARYPKAEYYGVDITEAINDGESLSRANFTFANVLEGLPYADETFDYVHQRQLFTGIPRKKWVSVIDELVRVTKPGGWIELMECDIPAYRAGPIDKMLTNAIASVIEKNGLDSRCGTNLLKYVAEFNKISRDSGIQLINVTGKVVSCPKNWNGKVGEACAKDLAQFLESMQLHLQRALNISSEAYAALIVAYLEECGRFKAFGNVHLFVSLDVSIGRDIIPVCIEIHAQNASTQ